ncbi:ATP-binding cassette sub- A member 5 [Cladochytrium tenue]|nr:ATP-binding cassette sub- A member 5 [Cladochytrium tenue]
MFDGTSLTFDTSTFTALLIIGIGLSISSVSYGIDIVNERAKKIKAQLDLNGVSSFTYWASTMAVDLSFYMVVAILFVVMIYAFGMKAFSGPAVGPTGDGFQNTSGPAVNLGVVILFIAVFLLDLLTTTGVAKILHFCGMAVIVPYAFVGLLYFITRVSLLSSLGVGGSVWDWGNNVVPTLVEMLGLIVLYFGLLYYLEFVRPAMAQRPVSRFGSRGRAVQKVNDEQKIEEAEDEDVATERQRVADELAASPTGPLAGGDVVALHHVRKEYRRAVAARPAGLSAFSQGPRHETNTVVADLSLGVARGQCLALLGPNGAGKSTTLGILVGEIRATRGTVRVGSARVSEGERAQGLLGYCPQHDALWDNLTPAEHLRLFAEQKLVRAGDLTARVDAVLDMMRLQEYRDVRVKALSGGTKRKLSYALTIVGDSEVIVLDEPSTGMDPASRRFMWNAMTSTTADHACILTTHSLEEAEAVCSKVAILINGRLVCIGSSQHLKSRFGEGSYLLEVKCAPTRSDDVHAFVCSDLASEAAAPVLSESFQGHMVYSLPVRTAASSPGDERGRQSLAHVFRQLELRKGDLQIEEYALSQVTLEHVFLEFAKRQAS